MSATRPNAILEAIRRLPSLWEIFFVGKLARMFRAIAQWRKQRKLRKAARQERRKFLLETLEPRLLLSADLTYGAATTATDLTLVAETSGPDLTLKLIETGNPGTVVATAILDDASDLDVIIKRDTAGPIGPDTVGDRIRIDLDSFDILNTFVSGHGGVLKIDVQGGNEAVSSDDHVNLQEGGAPTTLAYGLEVKSSSDMIVGVGNLTVQGDLKLTTDAHSSGLIGESSEIFASADGSITINGGTIHASAISIEAKSTIDISPDAIDLSSFHVSVATASSTANVTINGAASIQAAGDLSIHALSDVKAVAEIAPSKGASSTSVDAAVSFVHIDSTSKVSIGGSAELAATGHKIDITAENTVVATTTANAAKADNGAAVAVTHVDGDTGVSFTGTSHASADSISMAAISNRTATTTSVSSAGGATASAGGDNKSESTLADNKASSSGGDVNLAGAVSVAVVDNTTTADISTTGLISAANGAIAIGSTAKTEVVTISDGSTTGGGGTGVGVAVSINATTVNTTASVDAGANLQASEGITVSAENQASKSVAEAKAGASGSTGTGVAGSLAINVGNFAARADISGNGSINLNGSDLTISAKNVATNEAKATAAQASESESGDFGMGASFALNIGTATTTATTTGDITLSNAKAFTLTADGSHTTNTLAEAGGQSSGTGVGGAIAITVAEGHAEASVGASATQLSLGGDFKAQADHHGASITKADGKSLGDDTAVGAAIALGFVNDSALATTARDVTAAGAVSFIARNDGASRSEANASAAGADKSKESSSSSDEQAAKQTDFAKQKSGNNSLSVGKSANTSESGDSSGSVSVGAALALNVASADANATIGSGLTIEAGAGSGTGAVNLHAENNMDAAAVADASAAGGKGATSVGIGVALNIADMENTATVGSGTTITADGYKAEAVMKDVDGDKTHKFEASATSGASGGDTGVAGSFALNYSEAETRALLPTGVTVNAGTGDVTLTAEGTSTATVNAKASADSEKTGVGVSVALNIATHNTTEAKIDGTLNGGKDVSLSATGSHGVDTTAIGGGKSKSDTGVGGALAITVAENHTEASLSSGTKLDITGDFSAEAVHHGASTTTAKAAATGGSTAIGAAIALGFVNDSALATTARDITADGAVSFSAKGDGASKSEAIASSAGADKTAESSKGNSTADDQASKATGLANKNSGDGKTRSTGKSASTDDGAGSGGSVSVGAALALNVASSEAEATIGASRTIVAGDGVGTGALTLHAENNMDASAIADGSAAGGKGATSVGVAVALNIAFMENTATVGTGSTITADGYKAEAVMKDVGGNKAHKFEAKATSGASGGDTGVAGSFALNYSEAE
ncbi:MAG TPA: LEPR-XLL domain-containing protein, partial [Burkholderiales bacterium]|nr:LEPR-XLL domain-containing protein [Burkholderiales bacterium]